MDLEITYLGVRGKLFQRENHCKILHGWDFTSQPENEAKERLGWLQL